MILGRFVPENNYETAIREFMTSSTKRDLVIICNHEGNPYFEELGAWWALTRTTSGFVRRFIVRTFDMSVKAFAYIHRDASEQDQSDS